MAARKPIVLSSAQQEQIQSGDALQLQACVTGAASLNMPHGAVPTSPVNGDVWTTSAGIFVQINGATVGPLSASGGGTAALSLITETVTSGSQVTVTFSAIPGTYRDLIIRVRGRGLNAASLIAVVVKINSDTGANYDYESNQVQGGSNTRFNGLGQTSGYMGNIAAAAAPANVADFAQLTIADYRGTTFQKAAMFQAGLKTGTSISTNFFTEEGALWWRSTAAITQIDISVSGGFVNGSIVSLYGSS